MQFGQARPDQCVVRLLFRGREQRAARLIEFQIGLQRIGQRDVGRRRGRVQLDRAARIGQCGLALVLRHADHRAQRIGLGGLCVLRQCGLDVGARRIDLADREQQAGT